MAEGNAAQDSAASLAEGVPKRSERARMQETLDKITQLESRVQALERERSSHLYSKRHEFRSTFCSLEEAELKLALQRKSEKQEVRQQISRVRASVNGFRRMLADMKPGPAFVEKLRQTLEEIEASIIAFKEKQREVYEYLLREERVVSQEVVACEKRLESWLSTHPPPSVPTAPTGGGTQPAPPPSAMPPAVMAFERLLQQTGGRQGGWDDYDHQTFLRIRNRFNGQRAFLEAAVRELPTRAPGEVESHEQWYSEYCSLLESKRKAILAWRTQKRSVRVEQREGEGEGGGSPERKGPTKEELLAREREERLAKLSAWKAQQEVKQAAVEEERLRTELERARERVREEQRRVALRQQVQKYQQEREEERQAREQAEEAREVEERAHRRAATREILWFRERDLSAAAEKKVKQRAKELEKLEREKKLEKLKEQVEVKVSRDPSRLLRPTSGWEERRKAGPGSGMGGAALSMPRRAVPAWRQGL